MESIVSHSLACYNKRKNVLSMNLEEQQQHILSGAMYNDLTPELVEAREKTVFLTNRYNASFGQPASERQAILKEVLKSVGKNSHFDPTFRCEFGYNISIGDNFYANFDCVMLDSGGIEIGNNVLLGPRVGLYTSNYALDAWERNKRPAMPSRLRLATMSG